MDDADGVPTSGLSAADDDDGGGSGGVLCDELLPQPFIIEIRCTIWLLWSVIITALDRGVAVKLMLAVDRG